MGDTGAGRLKPANFENFSNTPHKTQKATNTTSASKIV
jgi:hypothetical protein